MEHPEKMQKRSADIAGQRAFDIDALLHPARAFAHPMDVVRDGDLTLNEKRAILSSWASDACALEAAPELRMNAEGGIVRWDDIMDALRFLDRKAEGRVPPEPRYRRVLAMKRRRIPTGGSPDGGCPLG